MGEGSAAWLIGQSDLAVFAPITARGEVDGIKFARPLLVGLPVLVRGAGQQNSGTYYVNSVTHRISRDDYRSSRNRPAGLYDPLCNSAYFCSRRDPADWLSGGCCRDARPR